MVRKTAKNTRARKRGRGNISLEHAPIPSVIVNLVCLAGAGYLRCSRPSPVEKDVASANVDSWRRRSAKRLDRLTRWLRCSTSWRPRIAGGGCSVPGGRTLSPAPCRPLLERRPAAS